MSNTLKSCGFLILALLAAPAWGQETNRYAVTFSYSATSPEVPSAYSAGHIRAVNSTEAGTTDVLWPAGLLGLSYGNDVDAASDGTDVLPLPAAGCRQIWVEYTVSSSSRGLPASKVQARRSTTAGDSAGPANDVFCKSYHQDMTTGSGVESEYLVAIELGINPDSILDALVWSEVRRGNMYFSIDPTTATALSGSAADIWAKPAGGSPYIWATAADLGLLAGDDIDALAIDFWAQKVVFSLTPGSPSLGTYVTTPPTTLNGADLVSIGWTESGGPPPVKTFAGQAVFMLASELELDASSDDLTGVRICDPAEFPIQKGTQKDPVKGWAYEQLKVNGTSGNVNHVVRNPPVVGKPTFQIDLLHQNEWLVLFPYFGMPCTKQAVPFKPAGSYLGYPPLHGILLTNLGSQPVNLPLPSNLPAGDLTFQGVLGAPGPNKPLNTTNMITIRTQ